MDGERSWWSALVGTDHVLTYDCNDEYQNHQFFLSVADWTDN